MFIQTEATPNPATLKFMPGQPVLRKGVRDYQDGTSAVDSPLAKRLFEIEGINGVFFGSDFISVTKDDSDWQQLKPAVLGAIMEHYMSGEPIVNDEDVPANHGDEFYDEADAETVTTIKELIETRVRPAVAQDGGDIVFQGYRDKIVYLQMRGACSGCPSSTATLRNGIENLLKHFLPEIKEVRPVQQGTSE